MYTASAIRDHGRIPGSLHASKDHIHFATLSYYEYMARRRPDVLADEYWRDTVLESEYESFLYYKHDQTITHGAPPRYLEKFAQIFLTLIVRHARNADNEKCGLKMLYKDSLLDKIRDIVSNRKSFRLLPPFCPHPKGLLSFRHWT